MSQPHVPRPLGPRIRPYLIAWAGVLGLPLAFHDVLGPPGSPIPWWGTLVLYIWTACAGAAGWGMARIAWFALLGIERAADDKEG